MKKTIAALLLCSAFLTTACESENEVGTCVGVAQEKDPTLKYDISLRNAILGVIFVETIFAPILVLHHEALCPTGPQAPASK